MNESVPVRPELAQPVSASPQRLTVANLLWFALPLMALVLAAGWLLASDWLKAFDTGAPPVEKLTFERTILDGDGIHLKVRAAGSEPISIAQIQINEAYWSFTQEPAGPVGHMGTAWLHVPYPWVLGEKHGIKVLSKTGTSFKKDIDVAVATPKAQAGQLVPQALLGIFVGIVPVVIGMLFYPAMRGVGPAGMNFVLALTVGLLAFLFIDSLKEALELAGKAAASFQGTTMVLLAAAGAFLLLLVIGRRHGAPTGLALAGYIALGIGLHNLGEGLAIGAAFAAGIAGLGAFLVLGFTLHNVTEGIGIVAPLAKVRPSVAIFAGLALLAGAPAILGIWLGSLSYSPQWAALALAIGAGAILQVIIEVGAYLLWRDGPSEAVASAPAWRCPSALAGLVLGIGLMYATAMLVKV
jgi:ZIP family zinc transporter